MKKVTRDLPNKFIDRLIVDLSSVGRASHFLGKDDEYGFEVIHEGNKVDVNGHLHAFDNWLRTYLHVLKITGTQPFSTLIVKDGKNSRELRQMIYPLYKAQRKSQPPELNHEYNKFIALVEKTILSLGGTVVVQNGLEADDIISYLSKKLKGKKSIWTGDGDMLALIKDDVQVYFKGDINPPLPGCPVTEWIPIYKALVGDTSDNLKGAKGFGKDTFLKFVAAFGDEGMTEMQRLIETQSLESLAENVKDFKPLQKIIDNAGSVYGCWACANFFDHKVNTFRNPLEFRWGYVHQWDSTKHHPDLERFYGSKYLVDKDDFPAFIGAIKSSIADSAFVTLDIEASTPDESDEWCKKINESGKTSGKKRQMFDSFGFELTGLSMTFGNNLQNTIYMPFDHVETENCELSQIKEVVDSVPSNMRNIVQNSSFELTVLDRTWGHLDRDNGWRGFLPNVWDTILMHQYVDENNPSGLKQVSKTNFGYDQVSYEDVTTLTTFDENGEEVARQYKMKELTAKHVMDYACDDTIMTAAAANRSQMLLEIEDVLETWEEVEFYTQYIVAEAFNRGIRYDSARLLELEAEDDQKYEESWNIVKEYLKSKNWPGTSWEFPEKFPKQVRAAFAADTGFELKTRCSKPDKLAEVCKEQGASDWLVMNVKHEDSHVLEQIAKQTFTGDPDFKSSSAKQMRVLLYEKEYLDLPVRLYNSPTQTMRDNGVWQGSPTTDAFAVKHAMKFSIFQPMLRLSCKILYDLDISRKEENSSKLFEQLAAGIPDESEFLAVVGSGSSSKLYAYVKDRLSNQDVCKLVDTGKLASFELLHDKAVILNSLKTMHIVDTRRGLYYTPYKLHTHWKDGRLHPSLGQSRTVTMRFAPNNTNINQLPKKGEGVRFRETILPEIGHSILAPDYSGQELRLQADYSQDVNFLSCYIGDNLRDVHSLTGCGIAELDNSPISAYFVFDDALKSGDLTAKQYRVDGKSTNFATSYGCAAPKLARTLVITGNEADKFIKAKSSAFPGVDTWKEDVVTDELMVYGYTTTKLGVRRHLSDKLLSSNIWTVREAERQGINAKIQGSGAEQTKLSLSRFWLEDGLWELGTRVICPVHDEIVYTTPIGSEVYVKSIIKPIMEAPYADMVVPIVSDFTMGPNFGKQTKY